MWIFFVSFDIPIKNILPELSRFKQENKELRRQFETVRKSHEELKVYCKTFVYFRQLFFNFPYTD